jgi:methylenetetrahydrofolate reductase (NADPH)
MRSWTAAMEAQSHFSRIVPHLRAMDFDTRQPLSMMANLLQAGIREVLVITGDPPQEIRRRMYPTNSVDLIYKIKSEWPEFKVYAGIDPYRSSMQQELEYARRKKQAGADGFFTQPLFDLRLMQIWNEMLAGEQVFWGVAPVLTDRGYWYWTTKNHVVFPAGFKPSLEWNVHFAKEVFEYVSETDGCVYIMPVMMNLDDYLDRILG